MWNDGGGPSFFKDDEDNVDHDDDGHDGANCGDTTAATTTTGMNIVMIQELNTKTTMATTMMVSR